MLFCIMMQTSFDANLVRAECSAVGVARALPLTDRDNFLCFLMFLKFLHMWKAAVFVRPMILAI